MVEINFDPNVLNRIKQSGIANGEVPARAVRKPDAGIPELPAARFSANIRNSEGAQRSRESSDRTSQTSIKGDSGHKKRMTSDELAEMLRKVNLTFDTFEVQAKFIIDSSSGDISVQVINLRTGEVIRKIPPYAVPEVANALLSGDPMCTDVKA